MALVTQPKIVAIILPEHLLCTCLSMNLLSRHNHPVRWVVLCEGTVVWVVTGGETEAPGG